MKRVFVSGPLTHGDAAVNVKKAVDAGMILMDAGFSPFIPHLSYFCHMLHPRGYEAWMDWCLGWLRQCEAVVRIPGESPGADRECALAKELGIPVYLSLDVFLYDQMLRKMGGTCVS